jgi:hypothetical protein
VPAPEREQARRLARVLDGEERGDGETAALAALLEQAAESARLEVPQAEVERVLAGLRRGIAEPPKRPERSRRSFGRVGLVLAGVGAAVVTAVVLLVVAPFGGLDVAAEANAALAQDHGVLSLVERVRPAQPGTFRESTRTGWLDLENDRARWTQEVFGRVVAETLVEPGAVTHYLPQQETVISGPSCATFAGGCADVVDPVAFYRDALAGAEEPAVTEVTFAGRKAYRIVLPVQALPDAARIEQVAIVDAETYLPRQVVWRDVAADGSVRPFAVIDIVSLRLVPRDEVPAGAFTLDVPADARVVERVEAGAVESERPISLDAARAVDPPLYWLGPEYNGVRLEAIDEVRLEGGTAYRLRYGDVVVWNYTTTVPSEIVSGRSRVVKVVPLDDGTARFTDPEGGPLIGEYVRADSSTAIVAPEFSKLDIYGALDRLEPLR